LTSLPPSSTFERVDNLVNNIFPNNSIYQPAQLPTNRILQESATMSQSNATFAIPSRVEPLFRLTLGESSITGAGRGLFACEPVPSQALIFRVPKPLICIVCTVNLLFQPTWIVLANHCTFCRSRKTRLFDGYAIIALDTRKERFKRLGMKAFNFLPALPAKSCTIAPKSVSPTSFPSRSHN
jgi:hypothetical protein